MLTRIPYGVWLMGLGAFLLVVGLSWKSVLPFSTAWTPLVVPGLVAVTVGGVQLAIYHRRKNSQTK